MFIDIGSRREVFWENSLIDTEKTTAQLKLHHPVKKELHFTFDAPWETRGIAYPVCVKDGDIYRMYYVCSRPKSHGAYGTRIVCMIESTDYVNWVRPNLGLHEVDGSTDNNVILLNEGSDVLEEPFDNFFVFIDENPDCLPEEKYKAIALCRNLSEKEWNHWLSPRELWCYTSPDGIHWKRAFLVMDSDTAGRGGFDSQNTVWWDKNDQKYHCFFRVFMKDRVRDIKYMESTDFKNWSKPILLNYGDSEEYELYTNEIMKYSRAPHMFVGFPMRYVQREILGKNFEQMNGPEGAKRRWERAKTKELRMGTAITDCLFMCSRDAINWKRYDEMFLPREQEHSGNWSYGDYSTPVYPFRETKMPEPWDGNELSFYVQEGPGSVEPHTLHRHAIRLDGFASYHADYDIKKVMTKSILFTGNELHINFSTSALGWIYVDIVDATGKELEGWHSCELFGNTTDRIVYFGDNKDVSSLQGKV
ncbi:MAG: hypothetical protein IJ367_01565, partial [Clostridia bacterium]|nr:hypothetical protein [Clostridia bacterium]